MGTESVQPIRSAKYFRPQQEWKEIIAIYLYLAGMGAGSFIIGILIHWTRAELNPLSIPFIELLGVRLDLAKFPILWGPIMVSIGAPFLILDLGIKWRFMYACLNPRTSWVARGFIILSIFIVLGLLILAKSLLPFKWLYPESGLWLIPEVIAFVFAFTTALYTGILLKATKSVPLWNTHLLPLLFLASALSTGSMSIILSTLGTGLLSYNSGAMKVLMVGEQICVVIEGIVLYLFLSRRYRASEQGKDSVRLLVTGKLRYVFWQGIILLGFVFPIALEWISKYYQNSALIFIAGLSLLTGGFFLRLGVLHAGIKDQIPMQRLMEIQYDLIKNPKSLPTGRQANI
ncbi:MAG: NrfD/PsrC family molybdoenzyme membrane anchor subunit [Deltaproteobacteria bacterium]|nr:NrfD/PsrC family molybdoenzyme membrane anchor subunit [Deltaproteobacteria bacterium]